MEFRARHAVEQVRKQVATTASVVRAGREQELSEQLLLSGHQEPLGRRDLELLHQPKRLPYPPVGRLLQFTPLPAAMVEMIAFLAATYLLVVQAVKSWFYRRHAPL